MQLDIKIENIDDETVRVHVQGHVNIHTSPALRKVLLPCFSSQMKAIHVMLNDVPFMDSSGIATLVEGLQWSRKSGGRFVLSGLSEAVQDVFVLAKLDSLFDIDSGEEAA